MKRLRTSLTLAIAAGIVIVAAPALPSKHKGVAGSGNVLKDLAIVVAVVLAAAALGELAAAISEAAQPRGLDPIAHLLRRKPPPPEPLVELDRLERRVTMGLSSAGELHAVLRPILLVIARDRLLDRHGIDIARTPERARPLLGDRLYALVTQVERPADPRAESFFTLDDLTASIATLEAL